MSELSIKENVIVCGVSVPNIQGGFGIDKKAMLVKHIAEIHKKELKKVNEVINKNRKRFKNNIDIMDLKSGEFEVVLKDHGILTQNSINRATNIYLLSERGYAKLIKIFDDDKSWDIYDQLLDEYFELRDTNVVPFKNKPMSSAEMLVVYAQQFLEQEKRLNQIEQQTKAVDDKVVKMQNYLIESPDFKTVQHKINEYARIHNMNQSEVRSLVYQKLEDKFGINVMGRAKKAQQKINEERLKEGKKPYKESTLKRKVSGMTIVKQEKLEKQILEILAGMINEW
ncbi:ORF6N domain-containing protein [Niallia circulans]